MILQRHVDRTLQRVDGEETTVKHFRLETYRSTEETLNSWCRTYFFRVVNGRAKLVKIKKPSGQHSGSFVNKRVDNTDVTSTVRDWFNNSDYDLA